MGWSEQNLEDDLRHTEAGVNSGTSTTLALKVSSGSTVTGTLSPTGEGYIQDPGFSEEGGNQV